MRIAAVFACLIMLGATPSFAQSLEAFDTEGKGSQLPSTDEYKNVPIGLLLPAVLHGTWDFALISGSLGTGGGLNPLAFVPILALIGLAITLLVRRKKVEPETLIPASTPL